MSLTELIPEHYAYASLEEADTYFSAKLDASTWEGETTLRQKKALTQATKIIDQLRFVGSRTESTQTNEFPRGGGTTIPEDVVNATCEIAYALLDGVEPEVMYKNISISSTNYSYIRTTYKNRAEEFEVSGIPSMTAFKYLRPYLSDPRAIKLI